MTHEYDSESPLTPPATMDPQWQEKIEAARRARALGKELRSGKDASFRKAVGPIERRMAWSHHSS